MKFKITKDNSWFWLSLSCFILLVSLISVEIGLFYPKVQRYFANTGKLTDQPLTARSRTYLIKSFEDLQRVPPTDQDYSDIRHNLDLAYGFLNLNLFANYDCTPQALENIDNLDKLVQDGNPIDIEKYSQILLSTIQCTDQIQTEQDRKRSSFALTIAANLDFHRKILIWGSLIIVATGLGFWGLHLKQRKLIAHNKKVANEWLRHAMRDALTGALNRRAFDTDLSHYVKKFAESGNIFSLLICDIDYFKKYNDSLGHVEGDKALRDITHALSNVLRDRDNLYRYGGEELVMLLDNTDNSQASIIGMRALEKIRNLELVHPKSEHGNVTISIGCAAISETDCTAESIIQLADKRLYQAKQNGRNCLVNG